MSLCEIRGLRVSIGSQKILNVAALDIEEGQTLGLVGESGSGKSMTALALLGLLPKAARVEGGSLRFQGREILGLGEEELRQLRGRQIAMVFQEPSSCLNPLLRIGYQIEEVLALHQGLQGKLARQEAKRLLVRVGLSEAAMRLDQYPHQFSGGMRQRAMIAMAIAGKPKLLIADEPTTALDVTIQAQILELIAELQRSEGMAVILITHDLGVVANSCKRVAVMYAGRLVEQAPVDDLFSRPKHPYTLGLLESIPRIDAAQTKLTPIPGQPPDLSALPQGCKFQPRCSHAIERCKTEDPPWFGSGAQTFRCFNEVKEIPLK